MSLTHMRYTLMAGSPGRVRLPLTRDMYAGETDNGIRTTLRDVPLSFSPYRRSYGWRDVVTEAMVVDNPYADLFDTPRHDPFAALLEGKTQ